MHVPGLQRRLIDAAKAHPPTDRVPLGFEKRVMASLGSVPSLDVLAWWSRALWRGALASVGVCMFLAVWSALSLHQTSSGDFSEHLEHTILASVNDLGNGW